jgi:DNA-binding transcriptional MerR regulator
MSELLPIGRFGKESQLSPRQLRYYHALGLLVPAAINPDSGYRYYASAQIATAELIALLRTADMPVADIQALLADRSQANVRAIFERLRAGLEQKLERDDPVSTPVTDVRLVNFVFVIGAGDEIRTRDFNLGKVGLTG